MRIEPKNPSNSEFFLCCFKKVYIHFGCDIDKTCRWFASKNNMFGNERPVMLAGLGKSEKLLKIIGNMLEGNLP